MKSSAGVKGQENPIEALKSLIIDVLSQYPGDPFKPEDVAEALNKPRVMVNRALSALSQDKKTKIKFVTDGDGGYAYFGKPVVVSDIDFPSIVSDENDDLGDNQSSNNEEESVNTLSLDESNGKLSEDISSGLEFNRGVVISSIAKLYADGAKFLSDKQIIAAVGISPEIFNFAQMAMEELGAIKSFEMPDFEDRMFKRTSTTSSFIDYEDSGVWLESSKVEVGEISPDNSSSDDGQLLPKKRGRKPGPKVEKIPQKRGRKPKAAIVTDSGGDSSPAFVDKMATVSTLKIAGDNDIDRAILDFLAEKGVAGLDAISNEVIAKARVSGRVNTRRIKVSVEKLVLNGVLSNNYGENGFEYKIADESVISTDFSFLSPSIDDFNQGESTNNSGLAISSNELISDNSVVESNLQFDFDSDDSSEENIASVNVNSSVASGNENLLAEFSIPENISVESKNVLTILKSSIIKNDDLVEALSGVVGLILSLESSMRAFGDKRQETLKNLKKMIDKELEEI
jgi:hypothetical protein